MLEISYGTLAVATEHPRHVCIFASLNVNGCWKNYAGDNLEECELVLCHLLAAG